ncbi:hypothetical protein SDC9_105181 [bioreactor metagenome]|uniref:Uncharacterized protein n=1 Tax=bioreactor metagenome TaxID=1076179 RepID=A0A645AYU6_9ZZZZ
MDFVQIIGSAQIHLHPLQAGGASRIVCCIIGLRISNVREIIKFDRTAECAFRRQIYGRKFLRFNTVDFDFHIVVCAVYRAPIGVEPCVTGIHSVESNRLTGARFAVFAVRAHTQAGTAVFIVIEDGHGAVGETCVIRKLHDHIMVASDVPIVMP